METILITGEAGFIGVVVIDDLSTGRMENITQCLDSKSFIFIKGNILVTTQVFFEPTSFFAGLTIPF